MIFAALATDLLVLGAIHLVARAGAGESRAGDPAPDAGPRFAQPPPQWARCLERKDGTPASIAAITYLDRGRDAAVTLGEVRGWFGKLAPGIVQVWELEPKDPRMGRRIAFEVPQDQWPPWLTPDPALTRAARCDALYVALRAHGVGRPRPADLQGVMDAMTRSRHDVEFLFPRRAEQYSTLEPVGTVADLTEARYAELLQWLAAPATGAP